MFSVLQLGGRRRRQAPWKAGGGRDAGQTVSQSPGEELGGKGL